MPSFNSALGPLVSIIICNYNSLVFGNAAKVGNEPERLWTRIGQFRAQAFVVQAFAEIRYTKRLAAGHAHAASFWYAVKNTPDFSMLLKTVILIWAVLVIVLPLALALPLARYVANAAAR